MSSLVACLGLTLAAPAAGTPGDPIRVDAFPYIVRGDTATAPASAISSYDCAPDLSEAGPELVYAFELAAPARVTARVQGDSDTVDVDVHILDDLQVGGGAASGCVARSNRQAEAELGPGLHHVVVDTFDGAALAGPFVLTLYAIGDAWFEHTIASGVTWRARRYADLYGAPQVVHALAVDLATPGTRLQVALPPGCTTVADAAAQAAVRPVAAINSSFFAGCGQPVSTMKSQGAELSDNDSGGHPRGAFGLTQRGAPIVGMVEDHGDWPEAWDAQGGVPLLVEGGEARQGEAAWATEGVASAAFLGPNPRTAIAYTAEGGALLVTIDGRRPNAGGLGLDDLAQWLVKTFAAEGAVNLDGGGSTTLWIDGVTDSGVVNYPSDAGPLETPDHAGARAVVGVVMVYAEPYNHPPRFQTAPVTAGAAGQIYTYDADAIDLDVDDVVAFSLLHGPSGMSVEAASGVVTYAATVESPAEALITLAAADARGGIGEQSFTLVIAGGTAESGSSGEVDSGEPEPTTGAAPDGGSSSGAGVSDGEDDGATGGAAQDDAGCGCRARGGEAWLSLALFGLVRRRRLAPGQG